MLELYVEELRKSIKELEIDKELAVNTYVATAHFSFFRTSWIVAEYFIWIHLLTPSVFFAFL